MEIRKSNRSQAKIKIAIQGASGSGKTYSSLLLAYGLCQDWSKIAIIDTENQSADLYSHLGPYNVLILTAPCTPERYIEAISTCEQSGMEVIICDSLSAEWQEVLHIHSKLQGDSFNNWSRLNPRHNAFFHKILHSGAHIIGTVRSKQEYLITEKDGIKVPERFGLKGVQKDGFEYDFSLVLDVHMNHYATCSKDRTQLFPSNQQFLIDQTIGQKIKEWCESTGFSPKQQPSSIESKIASINSLEELHQFYKDCPKGIDYLDLFNKQADQIRKRQFSSNFNFLQNGK